MVKKMLDKFSSRHFEDGAFMDDVRQATLQGVHPAANLLFWVIALFLAAMLMWASFAELDEVTSGAGKVIPSSQVQVVQNREGGIVQEILVVEGQVVEAGQPLLRIDNSEFVASLDEKSTKVLSLSAEVARLSAAATGASRVVFDANLKQEAVEIVAKQEALFAARKAENANKMNVLKRRLEQKRQEHKALKTKKEQAERAYAIVWKEYQMIKPLLRDGVVSEVEVLRLEQQVNQRLGEKEAAILDVPRAASAVEEAKQRLAEEKARQKSEILEELAQKQDELSRLTSVVKADADKVARGVVTSPVKASVKRVLVNTVGGVVDPGMDLVELVPLEDNLLIEAQILPKDIAFLRPHLAAKVKITAYDFTIYGDLDATLEHIGVDTVIDEEGRAFYSIRVRTNKNYLGTLEHPMPIIAGMVAQVDILTGKKTVLDYLLKPFNKIKAKAFRER